ncbi:MAG: CpaF family protein [Firmicutes bacterium]|nr:CpaF family protein [Bacillota bacterium]
MSLLERLEKEKKVTTLNRSETAESKLRRHRVDPLLQFKAKVHERLVETIDPELLKNSEYEESAEQIKALVEEAIAGVGEEEFPDLPRAERNKLRDEVISEVLGFGPITGLLQDDSISEIMVNGPKQVFVERHGKLELSDVTFRDDAHVLQIIDKIVSPLGRRIDESSPMVDARLPDGSRVNAIIPPLALNGPTITIRKFSRDPLTVNDLIRFGTINEQMAEFLEACVKIRLNIVVSGGTGSGKTTTLNVLSSFIPPDERIITVEDAAELQLRQEHVVSLEARPANIEGKGEISIRDLVKNCLRMRPDRIVVGEVRGGEALDMLQAMNTGHDGSLTTGHANSPRDMLARLETMVLMSGMDLPVRAIREQIASAIDLIIQQARLKDGSRRITHITEVQGMEGDVIVLQDLFVFEQKGVTEDGKIIGQLRSTGIRPKFWERFATAGISLPPDLFAIY